MPNDRAGFLPLRLEYNYDNDELSLYIPMDCNGQYNEIELAFIEIHAAMHDQPALISALARAGIDRIKDEHANTGSSSKSIN